MTIDQAELAAIRDAVRARAYLAAEPVVTDIPAPQREGVARLVTWVAKQYGITPPTITYFLPCEGDPRAGYMYRDDPTTIYVRAERPAAEIGLTAVHETLHCAGLLDEGVVHAKAAELLAAYLRTPTPAIHDGGRESRAPTLAPHYHTYTTER